MKGTDGVRNDSKRTKHTAHSPALDKWACRYDYDYYYYQEQQQQGSKNIPVLRVCHETDLFCHFRILTVHSVGQTACGTANSGRKKPGCLQDTHCVSYVVGVGTLKEVDVSEEAHPCCCKNAGKQILAGDGPSALLPA